MLRSRDDVAHLPFQPQRITSRVRAVPKSPRAALWLVVRRWSISCPVSASELAFTGHE